MKVKIFLRFFKLDLLYFVYICGRHSIVDIEQKTKV